MSVPAGSIPGMETETAPTTGLTDQDRAILDFEGQWFRWAGAKETAVRETFGMNYSAYYQRLNWLLEQPAALAYAPMTVRRLCRLRDERRAARTRRSV